jgi:hypothetical protein
MADIAFFEGRTTSTLPPANTVTPISAMALMAMRLDCNPVGQILVTPIVQDPVSGDYVRDLRILSLTTENAEPQLLLQVRLHALTVKQLEIHTPPSTF